MAPAGPTISRQRSGTLGRQAVSEGAVGADERTNGGTSLRGRTGSDRTGTGRGDGSGGFEAVGVEGG